MRLIRLRTIAKRVYHRCAQTGRYVTRRHADANPKTTIRETRP